MASVESWLYELGMLDQLARADTPMHRVDPRAKVIVTLVFLVCVVSFGKYDLLGLLPFVLFPIVVAAEGDLPLGVIAKRLVAAAPFAVVVGAFNPLLDHAIVGHVAGFAVSGGWASFASIVARFLLTTSAALVLIGTTSMNDVCAALQRMGAPEVFATQLLFLYRYIFVLGEEIMRIARARSLRSFEGRGTGVRVYADILGHLLLRTVARARRIYDAMLSRGFTGRLRTHHPLQFTGRDLAFVMGWSAAFVLFRLYNVPLLLGGLVTRVVS